MGEAEVAAERQARLVIRQQAAPVEEGAAPGRTQKHLREMEVQEEIMAFQPSLTVLQVRMAALDQ